MNNMPLVSIIVPVYNIEKYISKCIESVLSQTFKDWELILVDDGSTDNSGKICDEYALKDNRIKVIHKENEGVTATRDKGVKEAQGEFLFFIDGDDYITDNALELLINKQKENDADLVKGNISQVHPDGEIITTMNYSHEPLTITGEDFIEYIIGKYFWCLAGTLVKKNLLNNIFIPSITSGEDLIYLLQIAYKSKTCHIFNEIIYYYVRHESSRTITDSKNKISTGRNMLYISYNLQYLFHIYNFNVLNKYAIILLIVEHFNFIKDISKDTLSKEVINKSKLFVFKHYFLHFKMHLHFYLSSKVRKYCLHYSRYSYFKLWYRALRNIIIY